MKVIVQKYTNIIFQLIKFFVMIFLAYFVYKFLLSEILTLKIHLVLYIFFWLFSAYVILPFVNRKLSYIYVPNYYIGRTKTVDGLLGDPINVAFYGSEEDMVKIFLDAGWSKADKLTIQSGMKIAVASIRKKTYLTAPVSALYLFNEKQHIAFEKEVDDNPRRRHHIRLWRVPTDWRLPGGKEVDWLGSATYDKSVGLSLFTGQITHKIDQNIDVERDFVISQLKTSTYLEDVEMVENFTTSYHSRNGGGDQIETDGTLPFIHIK